MHRLYLCAWAVIKVCLLIISLLQLIWFDLTRLLVYNTCSYLARTVRSTGSAFHQYGFHYRPRVSSHFILDIISRISPLKSHPSTIAIRERFQLHFDGHLKRAINQHKRKIAQAIAPSWVCTRSCAAHRTRPSLPLPGKWEGVPTHAESQASVHNL